LFYKNKPRFERQMYISAKLFLSINF